MKRMRLFFCLFMILLLLASGCAPHQLPLEDSHEQEEEAETTTGPTAAPTPESTLPEETTAPEPTDENGNTHPQILLVNNENGLEEEDEPDQLVNVYEQADRVFSLATSDIELEAETYQAANAMFAAAEADGVEGFILTSGYRTRQKQQEIYDSSESGVAALPGHSEHETGLAFDVTAYSDNGFEGTEQCQWLMQNCWSYGFILRYPKDKTEITGISYEPWHYRYVGKEAALEIQSLGITLEEYVKGSY